MHGILLPADSQGLDRGSFCLQQQHPSDVGHSVQKKKLRGWVACGDCDMVLNTLLCAISKLTNSEGSNCFGTLLRGCIFHLEPLLDSFPPFPNYIRHSLTHHVALAQLLYRIFHTA